jgi:hypothetical protein
MLEVASVNIRELIYGTDPGSHRHLWPSFLGADPWSNLLWPRSLEDAGWTWDQLKFREGCAQHGTDQLPGAAESGYTNRAPSSKPQASSLTMKNKGLYRIYESKRSN